MTTPGFTWLGIAGNVVLAMPDEPSELDSDGAPTTGFDINGFWPFAVVSATPDESGGWRVADVILAGFEGNVEALWFELVSVEFVGPANFFAVDDGDLEIDDVTGFACVACRLFWPGRIACDGPAFHV